MTYAVIYERTGNGYSAYVPDLPGCVAAGAILEETTIDEGRVGDASGGYAGGRRFYPEPTTVAGSIAILV